MPKRFLLLFCVIAATLLALPPLAADVTIVANTSFEGPGPDGDGETVTKISGMKSRTEANMGRNSTITLMDLDKKEMAVLNERRKRAEVYDLTPVAQQQVSLQTHEVSLEPTGNKREAAGYSCEDHNLKARIEAGMEAMQLEVILTGVVCLSKDAPGQDEYGAFYKTMAERGLFLGNPDAAQAQPGRERGMTEMYRKMSEKGVALISDITVGFDGSGPMAAMMGRMKVETQTTVTSISTDAIPASEFSTDGYKIKRK